MLSVTWLTRPRFISPGPSAHESLPLQGFHLRPEHQAQSWHGAPLEHHIPCSISFSFRFVLFSFSFSYSPSLSVCLSVCISLPPFTPVCLMFNSVLLSSRPSFDYQAEFMTRLARKHPPSPGCACLESLSLWRPVGLVSQL